MKLPSKPKSPLAPDPDPLFRFERETLYEDGGRQSVLVALTPRNLGRLFMSSAMAYGISQNFETALPVLKRILLP
jgi:hypothetical protein